MYRFLTMILVALALAICIAKIVATPTLSPKAGEVASSEPVQNNIDNGEPWSVGKKKITPLATYDITALVLHTESYWGFGRFTEVSPLDLAVGWGPASDRSVIGQFKISQGDRFMRYRCDHTTLSCDEFGDHAANMHMLPANAEISSELKDVQAGQVVSLSGYLVRVDFPDGAYIVSSMSRTDRGAGACEVMWIEKVTTRDPD
jgi:hypothetical protein